MMEAKAAQSTGEAQTLMKLRGPSPTPTARLGEGDAGSLAQAHTEAAGSSPSPVTLSAAPAALAEHERYVARAVLGEGGMGEVRLCEDLRIGRDVAMKVIRPGHGSRSDVRARFEREARVQGQLEHPAIVPVYDLGVGPGGEAFFTMKRVRGHTLEQIVEGLRRSDPTFLAAHSRRRLLGAFSNVCLAVAFAHARGVLHRDLKPGNVMLGDFGEVYVLDWGLAKLTGAEGAQAEPVALPEASAAAPSGAQTALGAIMGTPGYMAPEQARGEIDRLDARADIYALGAILFELLTLAPLHARRAPAVMLAETVMGVEARPSVRAPERGVPPELEAICERATALDPAERLDSARAMHEAIERFLDGDRDTERRQELAEAHARLAEQASLGARAPGEAGRKAREEAIREVNRALALDPTHRAALGILLRLLLEPSDEVPAEAEAELDAAGRATERAASWMKAVAYLSWIGTTPFLLWLGIRSYRMVLIEAFFIMAAAALSALAFRTGRTRELNIWILLVSSCAVAAAGLLFGPFLLVPGLATVNTMLFAMNSREGRERMRAVAIGLSAFLVPLGLELAGVLPRSFSFHDGVFTVLPRMTEFPATPAFVFFLVTHALLVVVPVLFVSRVRDAALAAERRAFLHAFHLRQFLPDEARRVVHVPEAGDGLLPECVKLPGISPGAPRSAP